MFSIYHFIWIGICIILITVSLIYIDKKNISFQRMLPACCFIGAASEIIKTLSVFKMVPSTDGSRYYPYLELQYLPFHLCSIMLFVIFYLAFGTNEKLKSNLTGFFYVAGTTGGALGICLASIFSSIEPEDAFVSPLAYQTFIYHSMLFVMGVTIYRDRSIELTPHHFKITMIYVGVLGVLSLYVNSMFAVPVYENSKLQTVEYTTNFFFTYRTPIGLNLTTKEEWYIYLAIIVVLAVLAIFLLYLPVLRKHKGAENEQG